MSLASDLVNAAAMPDRQAEFLGFSPLTEIAGSSGVVANNNVLVNTAPGATSITFSGESLMATPYLTTCNAADALLVRPNSGGTINGAAQVSTAQNLSRMNFRLSADRWISFLTA